MKYYETHYDEYLNSAKTVDLHPELDEIMDTIPPNLSTLTHMILFGPSGAGKYTILLRLIERYSPSKLKYDKKITTQTEKQSYVYRISDIHYEVDLSLLGCESKRMWNECFFQVVDVISMKPDKSGIIVCKNFHSIHSELLDVFYSYMQHCNTLNIHVVFIILTDHISFIPNNITQCCKVVHVQRPSKCNYDKLIQPQTKESDSANSTGFLNSIVINQNKGVNTHANDILDSILPESILNLKDVRYLGLVPNIKDLPNDVFNIVCDGLIQEMTNHDKIRFTEFRDQLYDILLYGLDITDCLWYILYHFFHTGQLRDPKVISGILSKINTFLKYYNNNYRPIYHLESIFFYMITAIHKYPDSK